MKQIFTEELVSENNFGLFIIKDNEITQNIKDKRSASYAATVAFKLVYQLEKTGQAYGLCNFLTDGWTYFKGSKGDLINHLNEDRGGYRILSQEDLMKIITLKSNRAQLFTVNGK